MDKARNWTDKQLEKMERHITEIYKKSAHDVSKNWDAYMERAAKRIEKHERDLIDAQKVGDEDIINQMEERLRKAKENVTYRDRHYQSMLDAITDQLAKVNQTALDYINEEIPKIYAVNYNQAEGIAVGVSIKFNLINEQTVKHMILNGEDHMDALRKKINKPKDKRWNAKQITSSLIQGIIQGESIPKISRKIFHSLNHNGEFRGMTPEELKKLAKKDESVKDIIRKNRQAAVRNARTMVTGAENRGRNDSYKQLQNNGLMLTKIWMATPDGKTRDWHIDMDGQEVGVNESFIDGLGNELEYPGDPGGAPESVYNCRCSMVTDVKGFINPETGEFTDIKIHDADTEHEDAIATELASRKDRRRQKEGAFQVDSFQSRLGAAKAVSDINNLINSQRWFRKISDWGDGVYSEADLTGVDLDSAKSIAASYEQVFTKYPQLKGRIDAPDAHPVGMRDNTYAWCYLKNGGKVQVNPKRYNDWQSINKSYEHDVATGWHPYGTTAESIVTHEIGHAIDGLLAKEGVLGGYTKSGEFRYASSSMKTTVMKRAAKQDSELAELMRFDKVLKDNSATANYVSQYATKNAQEWFAECFAEYITSASPRLVAAEFGKELERLVTKLK